ncbi:interferon alpha/beta receptor 2-like isoform X2 [Brachyhypopomus gauderio]|uniref:interferon alpha/beta receptor 2-like isoform X2 n=1 Tax=Brachyhypopomus gauderio TaxID=698409 RepID=UPI00404205B6
MESACAQREEKQQPHLCPARFYLDLVGAHTDLQEHKRSNESKQQKERGTSIIGLARTMMAKWPWTLRVWLLLFILEEKAPCFLPAPKNVTIVSFNLEHKLTWAPGDGSSPSTHFRVQVYRNKRKLWVPVSNCSDLQAGELCDLTTSFKNIYLYHLARVQAYTTDHESNWTSSKFFCPLLETTLGPPVVSLTGCGNCLLLQLSPPINRGRHHDLLDYFFREYTVNVCRTRDKAQFTVRASSGQTLIKYLEKGAQYCITALAVSNVNKRARPSGPHCAFTSLESVATATVPVILGLLCVFLVLMMLGCAVLIRSGDLDSLHKHLSTILKSTGALCCLHTTTGAQRRPRV